MSVSTCLKQSAWCVFRVGARCELALLLVISVAGGRARVFRCNMQAQRDKQPCVHLHLVGRKISDHPQSFTVHSRSCVHDSCYRACARLIFRVSSSCAPTDTSRAGPRVSSKAAPPAVTATSTKDVDEDAIKKKKKLARQPLLGVFATQSHTTLSWTWTRTETSTPGCRTTGEANSTWTRCRSSRVIFCRSLSSLTALTCNGRCAGQTGFR